MLEINKTLRHQNDDLCSEFHIHIHDIKIIKARIASYAGHVAVAVAAL
jgi:hypothetical protein